MENVKFLIQNNLGDKSKKHETRVADSRHRKSKMLESNPVEDSREEPLGRP